MDSFYDAPRRPPQPIPRETFAATPVVPEISVLCPSNTPRNTFTPYNQWKKDSLPNNVLIFNKENINGHFQSSQNTSILKKQVRFESPVLQQRFLGTPESFVKKTEQHLDSNQSENQSKHKPCEPSHVLPSFEQMYMANIPNRQLDLSVIDLPKRILPDDDNNPHMQGKVFQKEDSNVKPKEKEEPKSYKEFLEKQRIEKKIILNDSVTDIYNYKRPTVNEQSLLPKTKCNFYEKNVDIDSNKQQYSPELCPKDYNLVLKDLKYKSNVNRELVHTENYFQNVAEAISQRKKPVSYHNSASPTFTRQSNHDTRGTKQNGHLKNITPQKPWFIPENNNHGDSRNKLSSLNIRNQDNSSPREVETYLRSQDLSPGSDSENTRNKYNVETIGTGVQKIKNHSPTFEMQTRNDSETVNSELGNNLINQGACRNSNYSVQEKRECYTQTSNDLVNFENKALRRKCDDEISVTDLLKIIAQQSQQMAQQNEQLLLLQKQVSDLICQQKEIEGPTQNSNECGQQTKNCYECSEHCCKVQKSRKQYSEQKQCCVPELLSKNQENIQDRCITSTQHENCEGNMPKSHPTSKKNKNNMPNFSIGLTTSFEVSIRRPHCNKSPNDLPQKNKQLPDFDNYESPKIQEITETESTESNRNNRRIYQQSQEIFDNNKETLVDASMVFKEPIRVREPCPSPEPSIKISMNDFEDSESEDDSRSPEIGPSFYRNLMVQVNKILQKAQIETTEEVAYNLRGQNLKNNTLHKVKETTLKHLRRIGVEVQNSEDSSHFSSSSDDMDSKSYDEDNISFAVKQLLMKYLPADHLAKIAYKEAQYGDHVVLTPKDKMGAIRNRPDFSFATVQYMKKYNLIANNQKDYCQTARHNKPESPKILDISKLKQQPKLL